MMVHWAYHFEVVWAHHRDSPRRLSQIQCRPCRGRRITVFNLHSCTQARDNHCTLLIAKSVTQQSEAGSGIVCFN